MKAARYSKRGGRRSADRRAARWPPAMWAMAGGLLLFVAFIAYSVVQHDPTWPPLPHPTSPPPRPMAEVRAAYAFAARRADVLQFVPCYCGCERHGHRSNVDCYIRDRVADKPVWDDHAFT